MNREITKEPHYQTSSSRTGVAYRSVDCDRSNRCGSWNCRSCSRGRWYGRGGSSWRVLDFIKGGGREKRTSKACRVSRRDCAGDNTIGCSCSDDAL